MPENSLETGIFRAELLMFRAQLYKRTLMSSENSLSNTRIKKSVYSQYWKEEKPVSRDGITQFFKVTCLESYEDTLDGLELVPASEELTTQKFACAKDYRLRYSLGSETSSSPNLPGKDFTNPNVYQLSIVGDGRHREVPADLCETFNYLIGLRVNSHLSIDGVLVFTGKDAKGYECSVLWCDIDAVNYAAPANWFKENKAKFGASLEIVYVNRDHTLSVIRGDYEVWSAKTLEPEFAD